MHNSDELQTSNLQSTTNSMYFITPCQVFHENNQACLINRKRIMDKQEKSVNPSLHVCNSESNREDQTRPLILLSRITRSSTPAWIAPVQNNCVPLRIISMTSKVRKFDSVQPMSISLQANPMASSVSNQVISEEAAAACKLGRFHWITFWMQAIEVINPTTPAMREKMIRKPVAMFPNGKYIGNIRAEDVRTDAVSLAL